LESNEATSGIVLSRGVIEHETHLPFGNRGARCHDLALYGEQNGHAVTVCIESKADESFGGTIERELLKAKERRGTRFPERLNWLTSSLLGTNAFEDAECSKLSPDVAQLPYQLLTAIAGTLLEAECQNAAKAVFVVHEFRTAATLDSKLDFNAAALNAFIDRLLRTNSQRIEVFEFEASKIVGPLLINESELGDLAGQSYGRESNPN
jgi:hypothetical protein